MDWKKEVYKEVLKLGGVFENLSEVSVEYLQVIHRINKKIGNKFPATLGNKAEDLIEIFDNAPLQITFHKAALYTTTFEEEYGIKMTPELMYDLACIICNIDTEAQCRRTISAICG